jgi:hypothetical protein
MSKLDGFEFVCCSIRPKIVPSDSIVSSSEGEISTDDDSLLGRLPNRYYHAEEAIEAREPYHTYSPYESNALINRQQLEAEQKKSSFTRSGTKISEEFLADESKKNTAKAREPQLPRNSGMDWLCSKLGTEMFLSDELLRDNKDKRRERRRQQRRLLPKNKFGDDDDISSDESCFGANCVEPKSGQKRRDKKRSSNKSNPKKNLTDEDRLIYSSNCTPMHANRPVGEQGDRQRFRTELDKMRVSNANTLDRHSLEDRASQLSDFTPKNSKRYEQIQLGPQKHRRETERKRSTSRTQRHQSDTDNDDRTGSHKAPHYHYGMKYNRYS